MSVNAERGRVICGSVLALRGVPFQGTKYMLSLHLCHTFVTSDSWLETTACTNSEIENEPEIYNQSRRIETFRPPPAYNKLWQVRNDLLLT